VGTADLAPLGGQGVMAARGSEPNLSAFQQQVLTASSAPPSWPVTQCRRQRGTRRRPAAPTPSRGLTRGRPDSEGCPLCG
jgi:hypothetical protein